MNVSDVVGKGRSIYALGYCMIQRSLIVDNSAKYSHALSS